LKFIILAFFSLSILSLCFAQDTASQIERSQEIIRGEEELMHKINREEKAYIEKIVIKGATKLSDDEINGIILPYQKKHLSKEDIQQVIELIKQKYEVKGIICVLKSDYQIEESVLTINIEEL